MQLVISLDPGSLANPDLDLRYEVPDLLVRESKGAFSDNGYDYTEDQHMKLFLLCDRGLDDPIWTARSILEGVVILGNSGLEKLEMALEAD